LEIKKGGEASWHLTTATTGKIYPDSSEWDHTADKADMIGTDLRLDLLSRVLDGASLRQQTIAQNIANVNTPGYRRLDVAFDEIFLRRLEGPRPEASLGVEPRVVAGVGGATRADGNNVEFEQEMTNLTRNTLLYQAAVSVLNNQISQLRSAITGR